LNLYKLYHPEILQWDGKRTHYFEGWYFKSVTRDEQSAIAVIPGISIEKDERHAFIQVFDARSKKSYYIRYGFEKFSYSRKTLNITIGKSHFSSKGILLDIDDKNITIKGELKFSTFISWPVTVISPGVMGWYAYLPTMECYHGVMSFNHTIEGSLEINGERVNFSKGKGYCEKDWGVSMPNSWIWMQSNHFENSETSFFASIAHIPWKKHYFTGFLAGFFHQGKIYKFATYTKAKVSDLKINGNHISFEIGDSKKKIIISGERAGGATLAAPKMGEMSTKIQETLTSKISISFYIGDERVYEGTGRNAGLEFVGDTEELLKGL